MNLISKRMISILLIAVMCLAMLPITAFAADGVSYLDYTFDEQTLTLTEHKKTVTDYTEVTGDLTSWSSGWYVVKGEVTVGSRITVSGEVHLILMDGAALNANAGIKLASGNTLHIYAQSTDPTIMGKLTAQGSRISPMGIGEGRNGGCGTLIVNGGVVTATGGEDGAGIGGAYYGKGGTVTVNGGVVNANGGYNGAGIGGGPYGDGGTLTVNGGAVNATGGVWASGIGGGYYGKGGTVTVNGGVVNANGGKNGAGIGGGTYGAGGTLTVNGGMVFQNKTGAIYEDNFHLTVDFTLPSGYTLTIGEGQTFTNEKTLINRGKVINNGTLINYGVIEDINGGISSYTNADGGVYYDEHNIYENGFCTVCGDACTDHSWTNNGFCNHGCADAYEPATEVNDKYDVDGDGYPDQVYEIANAGQLYWFAKLVNGTLNGVLQNQKANAILTENIVINENVLKDDLSLNGNGTGFRQWVPIENFEGVFNGAGHTISGLYINGGNIQHASFVRELRGKIENLAIADAYFYADSGSGYAAGISAITSSSAIINNCYVRANIRSNGFYAGGFVAAGMSVGGDVASITNSVFAGSISSQNSDKHPFVNNGYGNVTNCYYDSSLFTNAGVLGTAVTPAQFASGEIAYLLSNSSADGIWKQTIGEDAYPSFEGDTVYYGYSCATSEFVGYSNIIAYPVEPHFDENGFCEICGRYEPAELNSDGYYEIYKEGQLYWFAQHANHYFEEKHNAILMNDIVINESVLDENGNLTANFAELRQWTPISDGVNRLYDGVFDGNHHIISGLYVNDTAISYAALFGSLRNGCIKNLGITDSYFNGKISAAFAGWTNGTIENCFVTDTVIKGTSTADSFTGGYFGTLDEYDYENVTKNSYSTAYVYKNGTRVPAVSGRNLEKVYYLADTDDGNGGKTAKQFESGEVAYLLGSPWGQELEADALPVWNGKTVYLGFDCGGTDAYYSNSELLDGNDSNHIHGEWESSDTDGFHQRYICTREGCTHYMQIETAECHGGAADCQNLATCATCGYYYGDYDYTNHTGTETYMTEGDENGHQIYHACCHHLSETIAHSFDGYDFDSKVHWHACECGYLQDDVTEAHTFDGNGFCTVCGGYEPATIVYDEENYAYIAQIENAGQLFWYARNWNKGTLDGDGDGYGDTVGAVLLNDIDLNPGYIFNDDGSYSADDTAENYSATLREWVPIESFAWVNFDGQGHTISGLYINRPDKRNVGLFASNDYYTIKNLTLTNGFVWGGYYTAAVVGYNGGSVINCHSSISVRGEGVIGGIVAYTSGEVSYCSNSGSVVIYGSSSATGGIVGDTYGSVTINNCYNTGYIKGGIRVGGILGSGSGSTVQNCYNMGVIISAFYDGHGISKDAALENCYTFGSPEDGEVYKTKEQFESGEVAYLLQAGQPWNDIYDDDWNVIGTEQEKVWGQTIGTDAYPTLGGAKVYEVTDCKGNPAYSNTNVSGEHIDADRNGLCDICGEKISSGVNSWNLSLHGDIRVNFLLKLVSADEAVEITVDGESFRFTASDMSMEGNLYKATVGIAAAQMTQPITVKILEGGETKFTETYTVRQYCDTILADESYSQYHTLVKEMLNYGGAAQIYFDYDAENLANDGITGVAAQNVPETAEELVASDSISGLNFYGASLVYRDRVAVRFYFTGDITGCTFTANGNTYTPVAKDGMYYVEIPDVLPQDIDQQITLTVTDASGNTLTVTYSPMNYIVRMNGKGSAELQNLLKALYNYHLAAKTVKETK